MRLVKGNASWFLHRCGFCGSLHSSSMQSISHHHGRIVPDALRCMHDWDLPGSPPRTLLRAWSCGSRSVCPWQFADVVDTTTDFFMGLVEDSSRRLREMGAWLRQRRGGFYPFSLKQYFRTACNKSADGCQMTPESGLTYRSERVQPLLSANVHVTVLLDSLVHDFRFRLAAFADGFHLQLHLSAY